MNDKHKDKNGLTVDDFFSGCDEANSPSWTHDGIPYVRKDGKWVVDEELLAEVKRQGYYTDEQNAEMRKKLENTPCCGPGVASVPVIGATCSDEDFGTAIASGKITLGKRSENTPTGRSFAACGIQTWI